MKFILALLFALSALSADAATYYYSRCDAGSHASCVAGSDGNAGTDPSAPKLSFPTGMTAGNSYLLARGSSWAGMSARNYSAGTSKASPIVLADYTPAGCTGDCATQKPIIAFTGSGFNFTDSGNADHDEGYTLRNLDIRGAAYTADCSTTTGYVAGANGVFGYNDADYVTIDGVSINGFEIGIYLATGNTPNPGADQLNAYWTIKNSTICNNKAQGFLGAGPQLHMVGNTFDNNGHGGTGALSSTFYHNVYLDITVPASGIVVRGNTLTRNSIRGGKCTSVSLVAHGNMPDMLVEGNSITETASETTCFAVAINGITSDTNRQDFSRLVLRGNVVSITGDGSVGISCNSCPHAIVENNTVVRLGSSSSTFYGVSIPYGTASESRGDVKDGNQVIRNNSVYSDGTSADSEAIRFGTSATWNNFTESVIGNMVVFAAGTSTSAKCFNYLSTRDVSTIAAMDRNLCYRPSAAAVWSGKHATLALAQAAGLDTNSSTADPTLTAAPSSGNGYSMAVNVGSPAINACSSGCSRTSRDRYLANGTRDIGSHEYGATVQAPVGPSQGRAQ